MIAGHLLTGETLTLSALLYTAGICWAVARAPWLELVSGLFLLAGVRVRAACVLICGMLVMFILAIVWALILDTPIGCGCFQSVGDAISWWTVLRDVVWLGLGIHVYRFDSLVHLDRLFTLEPEELGL